MGAARKPGGATRAEAAKHDPLRRVPLASGGAKSSRHGRKQLAAFSASGKFRPHAYWEYHPMSSTIRRRGGFILWFTGLSGAGKSTLSQAIAPMIGTEFPVEILDGDEVRTYLSKGLTFSKEDRDTNIRRIGFVARLLARNGVATIAAAISPYAELRSEVRRLAEADGVTFIEVHVDAPIATLMMRDVKGLYKKALAGQLAHFTGVSDPYEPPTNPDIVVRTDQESVEASLERIVAYLRERELVGMKRSQRSGYEI
jgi:adenylylsulfate kinase